MDAVTAQFVASTQMVAARRVRHDRTARRARLPDLVVHLAGVEPTPRRVRRRPRRTGCASRSRCSPRCVRCGRTTSRCRCGSRPTTGSAITASRPTRRWRSPRMFSRAGADIIDVSAGQTSVDAQPVYGRMFQTPFSDRIRNEAGIATMAVGNIYEPDHVNSILMAGRADLVCLARPHLADPYWTLRAALALGRRRCRRGRCRICPGRDQAMRLAQRAQEAIRGMTLDTAAGADHGRWHRRRCRPGAWLRRGRCRRGRRRSPARAARRRGGHRSADHARSSATSPTKPTWSTVFAEAGAGRHRHRQRRRRRERSARHARASSCGSGCWPSTSPACSSPCAKVCGRWRDAAGAG